MFIIIIANPPHNPFLIPVVLAAIGIYCIYVGVKGLLEADEEN